MNLGYLQDIRGLLHLLSTYLQSWTDSSSHNYIPHRRQNIHRLNLDSNSLRNRTSELRII